MRLVLDTNVLVAAFRSRTGASNALVRELAAATFRPVANVALFLEYEAVLLRPEHRAAVGASVAEIQAFLDSLAFRLDPAETRFSWRPQLADAADEMVLEAAVNGRSDAIVTFNTRHFGPAARFGIRVWTPPEAMRGLRHGTR